MSTILDALRKVEEANRMKNTDVRTRLLTGSSRFDLRRPRHQRLSWFIVVGLILIGIIVGTGVGRWKRQHPSGGESPGVVETPAASQMTEQQRPQRMAKAPIPLDSEPVAPPQVAPADRPQPRIAETPFYPDPASGVPARPIPPVPNVAQGEGASVPVAAAGRRNSPDQAQASPSNFPRASLSGEEGKDIRDSLPTNPVQRSPFVNTPEPERIAPPSPPPPVERRVAPKAKPPAKPSPAPRAPAPPETATRPSVEPPPAPLEEDAVTEATPPPTPASVSFLQWSPEPEKRMAFIKIGDGPTTLAHEGDTVNGVRVVKILQGAVELQSGDSRWTLKAR